MTLSEILDRPNYSRAKALAESFVRDYHKPPIPIRDIIERNGVDVKFVQFGGDLSSRVSGVTVFAEKAILVNANDPMNRQTFTMAHEFGHWVMHKDLFLKDPQKYQVLLRHSETANESLLEKEANAFAANILVPVRLLKPVKNIATKSSLAQMFAVSEKTIEHRLKYV